MCRSTGRAKIVPSCSLLEQTLLEIYTARANLEKLGTGWERFMDRRVSPAGALFCPDLFRRG